MNTNSSRPPAGVPGSGGNTKYAIVAILLVLGVAGIIWRLTSRPEPPPPPVAAVVPSSPPSNPKLDDIPPPTPPEEKPEGGPTGPRIVYVQAAGCEGKCFGQAPPELGQVLQVRAAQARRCYNQALASDSSLKGHVTVAVRIGPSGNVCSATVASSLSVNGTAPVVGGTSQFKATATMADGSTQDVTSQATWQSSDTAVATVSSAGVVTGVASGSVTVNAVYLTLSASDAIVLAP